MMSNKQTHTSKIRRLKLCLMNKRKEEPNKIIDIWSGPFISKKKKKKTLIFEECKTK